MVLVSPLPLGGWVVGGGTDGGSPRPLLSHFSPAGRAVASTTGIECSIAGAWGEVTDSMRDRPGGIGIAVFLGTIGVILDVIA